MAHYGDRPPADVAAEQVHTDRITYEQARQGELLRQQMLARPGSHAADAELEAAQARVGYLCRK